MVLSAYMKNLTSARHTAPGGTRLGGRRELQFTSAAGASSWTVQLRNEGGEDRPQSANSAGAGPAPAGREL